MLSNIRKVIVATGVLALCFASAVAGQFYISASSGSSNSGTAVVPSAGSCGQVCFVAYAGGWSTNTGPLGTYSLNKPYGSPDQYLTKSGPVAPGSYGCYVGSGGSAWASVTINW